MYLCSIHVYSTVTPECQTEQYVAKIAAMTRKKDEAAAAIAKGAETIRVKREAAATKAAAAAASAAAAAGRTGRKRQFTPLTGRQRTQQKQRERAARKKTDGAPTWSDDPRAESRAEEEERHNQRDYALFLEQKKTSPWLGTESAMYAHYQLLVLIVRYICIGSTLTPVLCTTPPPQRKSIPDASAWSCGPFPDAAISGVCARPPASAAAPARNLLRCADAIPGGSGETR